MAFLTREDGGTIDVVVSKDSCVKADQKGYEAYLKSFKDGAGDESHLKLDGDPTRFTLKKQLTWQEKQRLRSKNIKILGRKASIDVNYTANMVRLHIVGIKNPEGVDPAKRLNFEQEGDGGLSFKILNQLDNGGSIPELLAAVTNAAGDKDEEEQKKS